METWLQGKLGLLLLHHLVKAEDPKKATT